MNFAGRFLPTFQQLQSMKLDKNAFVVISVIGQELLASNYHAASVVVLESALRIGTCSLKLRGSVFSALSSAHWGLKNSDQAIAYMQQDLSVAKSLGKAKDFTGAKTRQILSRMLTMARILKIFSTLL